MGMQFQARGMRRHTFGDVVSTGRLEMECFPWCGAASVFDGLVGLDRLQPVVRVVVPRQQMLAQTRSPLNAPPSRRPLSLQAPKHPGQLNCGLRNDDITRIHPDALVLPATTLPGPIAAHEPRARVSPMSMSQ